MKNKKYYTPEIEEIHVGFECEYSTLADTTGENHRNWEFTDDVISGKIDTFLLKSIIIEMMEEGKDMPLRVKYLDQEDIESFGFKHIGKSVCNWYKKVERREDGYSTYGYWNSFTLTLCEDNKVKIFAQEYDNDSENTLFQGTIKNKSELKKLLKQLNIL